MPSFSVFHTQKSHSKTKGNKLIHVALNFHKNPLNNFHFYMCKIIFYGKFFFTTERRNCRLNICLWIIKYGDWQWRVVKTRRFFFRRMENLDNNRFLSCNYEILMKLFVFWFSFILLIVFFNCFLFLPAFVEELQY